MTEQEKTAMKAVLYLAEKSPRLHHGGIWVENIRDIENCQRISFAEAIRIVGGMLYGPIEEVNNDG